MFERLKSKKGNAILEYIAVTIVAVGIIASCYGGFSNATENVVGTIGKSYNSTDTCNLNGEIK